MLQSPLLAELRWIQHGFGTRLEPLSQDSMVSLQQIHSADVLTATRPHGCEGQGDALVTAYAGVTLSIRTADCLPIFLVDLERRAIAAVHAGWRGTAAGIVGATLARMHTDFGTTPGHVLAAIGPGIGPCCYQVGPEVAQRFGKDGTVYLDLAAENQKQLEEARVGAFDTLVNCTKCDPDNFHSYRRDQEAAGRMISFIGILPV